MKRGTARVLVLACALITGAAGCQAPSGGGAQGPVTATPQQVAEMLDPNVVGVVAYYDPYNPWLWNENRTRPRGIVIQALYLEGNRPGKGVFGDGVISPRMYVRTVDDQGEPDWKLAKEWNFTAAESIPYRSKKQTTQGWGYRFHLPWGDLDIAGREIRMIVQYRRSDGRTMLSGKKDFRVPGARSG